MGERRKHTSRPPISGLLNLIWELQLWKLVILAGAVLAFSVPAVIAKGVYSSSDNGKSYLLTNPEWTRRRSKNSECRLGGARHPLNSTWSPDLGPPFGVWGCVKCTCTPVRRKRRIVAKVICKNVKTECPTELQCKKPLLYPGACCKICPDDGGGIDEKIETVQEEEINELEEDSLAEKDFAVLLNGRTSIFPVTTKRLATGRIFLRRGTLHFSFVKSPDTPSPSMIEFQDEDGNILEELESQPTPYETNNGRICGTWTRVPRQYRKLLLKEKMWVALTFDDDDDVISGRIARYKGVNTEVFSALLSRSHPGGQNFLGDDDDNSSLPSGGTAIISVSAPSDSLHISLVFNGIFLSNDERNVSLAVELLPSRSLEPVQDIVILDKAFSDINEANVLTTLGKTSLRLLTRGKVSIKIWSTSAPHLAIEGLISSRATCNVFYSVLTSTPKWGQGTSHSYGAGWGLLFLTNDGDFNYQIRLENLPSRVEGVVLDTEGRRRAREVEDVTHALSEGWVNGTYTKPTYRDLDVLLRGKLRASVVLEDGNVLEGVFDAISVTEALRSVYPTLLTSPSSWMAATAWAAVDEDCVMHYDVRVGGVDPAGGFDPTWSLQLRENDTSWDPRLDHNNVTLEQVVSGREIAAHTVLLTKISLSRLHHGVSYLELAISSSKNVFSPDIYISASLTDVVVPPSCRLEIGAKEYSEKTVKHPQEGVQVDSPCKGFVCLDEEIPPVVSKKCIDDKKKVYEDGTTWKSPVSNCARCMCTLGIIKCEDEPCPKPSCVNAVIRPGQCCPSCPAVSGPVSEKVCEMDGDFHIIGAFWHPFLAPNGFDKCVTCYCNVTWDSSPVVDCQRVSCPRLKCHDSEAKFIDKSCCPVCPPSTPSPQDSLASTVKDMFGEGTEVMADHLNREEVLANGGCLERKKYLHPNGDVWYPKLSPNGISRCVSCKCKNGEISCVSMTCPKEPCKKGKKCRNRKSKYRKSKSYYSSYRSGGGSSVKLHRKKGKRRDKSTKISGENR